VVEPIGATFADSIPLLLHHDSRLPVGTVKLNKATKAGITFEAQLPDISEPGTLKDRIEEAWASVKAGLIRGVSIGFRALDDGIEVMKNGRQSDRAPSCEPESSSLEANHEHSGTESRLPGDP
jgi:phage head maturation protease